MKHIYLKFAKTTFIKSLLGIVMLLGMQGMLAQVTSTTTGGNWNDTATWVGGVVPVAADNVVIATTTGNSVAMDVNLTMSAGTSVTVNDAASLSINAGIASTFDTLTVTGTGTCTNNGTVTISTSLAGVVTALNPGFTNASTGILNLTGTTTITILTASAAGNTVNYNGAAQTVKDVSYGGNLTISGSGIKTWTTGGGRSVSGNLLVNSGSTLDMKGTLAYGVTGTTIISGTLTFENYTGAAAKTFSGEFTVNSGGTFKENATLGQNIIFGSNVINYGTITAGTGGTHILNGSTSPSGVSLIGSMTIPKIRVDGVITYTNYGTLIVSTTLNVNTSTGSFINKGVITTNANISGGGTITNSATGIINISTTTQPTVTNFDVSTVGNTVNYTGGTLTVRTTNVYDNLGLSGSGTKTIGTAASGTLCTGTLRISGTTLASVTNTNVVVDNLLIGATGKIGGTWGSTASAATNTDDTAFLPAATGYINVTNATTTWNAGWNNGTPTAVMPAIIGGDYNTGTDGAFTANKLTIYSGRTLTVASNTSVTVTNEVNNNGTLVIQDNANLVQTNNVANTGNVTVNRNGNALKRLDYTMWSSPVANATSYLAAFSPATVATRFYNYDSGTNFYTSIASPSTTPFTVGKGVLIRMPDTDPTSGYDAGSATLAYPGVFTGVPNNGTVNIAGTAGQYVAVGNPYPSTISANAFIAANLSPTDPTPLTTLYFWRKTNVIGGGGTSYASYTTAGGVANGGFTPSADIAVGQGFITTVPTANTIVFTNAMRTSSITSQFLRTKQVNQKDRVWLNLSSGTDAVNQMLVAYMDGATTGIDNGIDGKYINDAATALTSNINGGEYVIQGRPAFDASDVVALNFKAENAGTFTIAKDHADGLFATGQEVYLVDATTGSETNLQTDAYTFTAAAGVDNERFSLKYQKTLGVNAVAFNDNSVTIFRNNGIVTVNSEKTAISNIKVYDVQGRLVAEQNNVNATSGTIKDLRATHQVLLIKVTGADNSVVTKKVVN